MTKQQKPNSDTARQIMLQQSLTVATRDEATHRAYLAPATQRKLTNFVPQYTTANANVRHAIAERRKALVTIKEVRAQVEVEVKSLWSNVRLSVRHQQLAYDVLPYYQLPVEGKVQTPRNFAGWLTLAQGLLKGDDEARAAGYPGALNRAALEQATGELEQALAQLKTAERALQTAQQARATLRKQATLLCNAVISELRHALHDRDPGERRRIMRTYGVTFSHSAGDIDEVLTAE